MSKAKHIVKISYTKKNMEINFFHYKRIKMSNQVFKVPQFLKNMLGLKTTQNQEVGSSKNEAVEVTSRIMKKAKRRLTITTFGKINMARTAIAPLTKLTESCDSVYIGSWGKSKNLI